MSFAEAASCEQRANAITAQKRPRKEFFTGGCMKPNLSDKFWLVEKFLSGVRSQESGVRRQEAGVRSQESGVRSQESGVRSQESGVRSQESGVRSQESGCGSPHNFLLFDFFFSAL